MNAMRLSLVFGMSLLSAVVHASPCADFGAPSPKWRQCADEAVAAADAKLNAYLRAAQARVSEMDQDALSLSAAQAAWLSYRTAHCGDVYNHWGTGAFRYEASLQCNLELTRERAHDLWSSYLTNLDSAPPVLAEP